MLILYCSAIQRLSLWLLSHSRPVCAYSELADTDEPRKQGGLREHIT